VSLFRFSDKRIALFTYAFLDISNQQNHEECKAISENQGNGPADIAADVHFTSA
jgi:hypothetical protein